MDLNYLFLRQQVERSMADAAASEPVRSAHLALAREYEKEIERITSGAVHFDAAPVPANDVGAVR